MLTERQREIYVQAGVPRHKTVVAPNFLPDELDPGPPAENDRHGTLFVGRLSEEKGIVRLLDEWPNGEPLVVVGDGPLRPEVEARTRTRRDIHFLGAQSRRDVLRAMQRHRRLVFPSRWLEGFPLIYVEALACGLPILAFRPSALADIAPRDGTGVGVSWEGQWLSSLSALGAQPSHFRACREVFEQNYSEAAFLRRVEALTRTLADAQCS
jgi:glycosyltransferase involved in cell wall biosynthesis